MSDSVFLSIVIPVYNAADTISVCLDSIWSQSLNEDEYEVICVNDCSTDNSVAVITDIQQSHPNLRLLHNAENLRAGGARNHGVREAKGEYILFIDADDYFHKDSLKTVVKYQRTNHLDILVCDFARHTALDVNDNLVHNFKSQKVMSGREFLVVNSLPYAPWKYVFKRDLMMDNYIFFVEKLSCEDVDWSHKIAFFANSMQYQPILLTHYILMDSSQTSVEYKNANTVFHRLQAGKRVSELVTLCITEAEKRQILAVAKSTLKNGIIFINGLFISPRRKADIIKECVSSDVDWGRAMNFIRDNAFVYSCFSTIIALFFRTAVYCKRKFIGR
ncbi:MAG: glycosyltransferase family 2 protein [Candidatus Aphodosoma sp.]